MIHKGLETLLVMFGIYPIQKYVGRYHARTPIGWFFCGSIGLNKNGVILYSSLIRCDSECINDVSAVIVWPEHARKILHLLYLFEWFSWTKKSGLFDANIIRSCKCSPSDCIDTITEKILAAKFQRNILYKYIYKTAR